MHPRSTGFLEPFHARHIVVYCNKTKFVYIGVVPADLIKEKKISILCVRYPQRFLIWY